MRFMEDRVGEDFSGIVSSCTKYGFFDDLFIEGLVPIAFPAGWGSDERYVFRDTDRQPKHADRKGLQDGAARARAAGPD